MKLTKSLFLAFAGLGLFACSNEDVTENGGDNQTASVVIKLDGVGSSRAVDDATTGSDGEGNEITLLDGKILFTDGTTILKVVDLSLAEAKGSGQLVHEVPAAVSQVQIVGNVVSKPGLLATIAENNFLAGVKDYVIKSGDEQDMDYLPLFGEDTSLEKATGVTDDQGHTDIYAANVELSTPFSRIEIGDFKCTNLGNIYSQIDIKVVGLLNFYNEVTLAKTASDKVDIANTTTDEGKVVEPGLTAEGKITFGAVNTTYGWAWEESTISMTNANTAYNPSEGKKYVYNFVPQGDDVMAALYVGATPKVSAAMAINNTLKGKLGTLNPGYIYKVSYTFTEGDINPWNPDATKCVNVVVTVTKWTIRTITPTFE